MNIHTIISFFSLIILLSVNFPAYSYPHSVSSNMSPSQIDQLCSYVVKAKSSNYGNEKETSASSSLPRKKRFTIPFPDVTRFLSNNRNVQHHKANLKTGKNIGTKKHDIHAYLCSVSKDSQEMSNFINNFVEEHGVAPGFNLFESCEQVSKRDRLDSSDWSPSAIPVQALKEFCSNRPESKFTKRWKHSVGGPMSIDFIHQLLESRKVKSYPYSAEVDPYLVGR